MPLLPGLALLHGVYAILNEQHAVGFGSVLGALAIGTALAAASHSASGARGRCGPADSGLAAKVGGTRLDGRERGAATS